MDAIYKSKIKPEDLEEEGLPCPVWWHWPLQSPSITPVAFSGLRESGRNYLRHHEPNVCSPTRVKPAPGGRPCLYNTSDAQNASRISERSENSPQDLQQAILKGLSVQCLQSLLLRGEKAFEEFIR